MIYAAPVRPRSRVSRFRACRAFAVGRPPCGINYGRLESARSASQAPFLGTSRSMSDGRLSGSAPTRRAKIRPFQPPPGSPPSDEVLVLTDEVTSPFVIDPRAPALGIRQAAARPPGHSSVARKRNSDCPMRTCWVSEASRITLVRDPETARRKMRTNTAFAKPVKRIILPGDFDLCAPQDSTRT